MVYIFNVMIYRDEMIGINKIIPKAVTKEVRSLYLQKIYLNDHNLTNNVVL